MLVYVKRHFGFKSTLEAIWVDGDNNVEELEYSVRLEDAAWFTLKEKWAVLDPRMKIKDLPKILHGDGRTPETCFEAKFRVGGELIIPLCHNVLRYISCHIGALVTQSSQCHLSDDTMNTEWIMAGRFRCSHRCGLLHVEGNPCRPIPALQIGLVVFSKKV